MSATISTVSAAPIHAVRLGGHLGPAAVPALREALLRGRPVGCWQVVVDCTDVRGADDPALAVLHAAGAWASDTGGELEITPRSSLLGRQLDELPPVYPDLGGSTGGLR